VFLLVLAHPGSSGQRAVKWLLLLLYDLWLRAGVMEADQTVNENEADSVYAIYTQMMNQ